MPQLLVCGLFVDRSQMAAWLHAVSHGLPLTYVLRRTRHRGRARFAGRGLALDVVVVVGATLPVLALGAAPLRRSTA